MLEIVARRFESEVPAPLREADSLLRTIHSELVGLITTPTVELDMGGGWALDRGWRAAVLGVASTRPRVLLTVGANALRSLDEMYGHVLEEPWEDDVVEMLRGHRERLRMAEAGLLAERARLTGPAAHWASAPR